MRSDLNVSELIFFFSSFKIDFKIFRVGLAACIFFGFYFVFHLQLRVYLTAFVHINFQIRDYSWFVRYVLSKWAPAFN